MIDEPKLRSTIKFNADPQYPAGFTVTVEELPANPQYEGATVLVGKWEWLYCGTQMGWLDDLFSQENSNIIETARTDLVKDRLKKQGLLKE